MLALPSSKTVEDYKDYFLSETIETIKKHFYVDDCLKSVATEADAVKLSQELKVACTNLDLTNEQGGKHKESGP